MAMTPEEMKGMIRSICEEVVGESLGTALEQLETLFNNSLAAYAQTITANRIAGELDEQIGRAYENMVLMEAQRISGERMERLAEQFVREEPLSDEYQEEVREEYNPWVKAPTEVEPRTKTKLKAVEGDS